MWINKGLGFKRQLLYTFQMLPEESRVIRVMPNTPAIVQSAASVFTRGRFVDDYDAGKSF